MAHLRKTVVWTSPLTVQQCESKYASIVRIVPPRQRYVPNRDMCLIHIEHDASRDGGTVYWYERGWESARVSKHLSADERRAIRAVTASALSLSLILAATVLRVFS
jgi:hypothetical protein